VARTQFSEWLPYWSATPRPLTLIAFPHAGGGAGIYTALRREAPEWLDIQPVQLPGREDRLGETIPDTLNGLLEILVPALSPALDRPYALMGYSMGARIACSFAHQLTRSILPAPRGLILAAHAWPSTETQNAQADKTHFFRQAGSAEFWDQLKSYGGTPEALFDHPDLMMLLEPMLRADFNLAFSPMPPDRGQLAVPILSLSGLEDPHASPASMAGWASETTSAFRQQTLAGGHFFLHSHLAEFRQAMADFLVTDISLVASAR
jgi:medium-chain acyl-[acyl-carrier-protein] hydrolase